MKKIPKIFLLLLPLLSLVGCVSPVRVDYDRGATPKFQSYKCFAVDSREQGTNYQGIALSPIVDRRIERALKAELLAKGFTQDCATPDFRVAFNTAQKTITELNDLGIGATPYRRPPYRGYGGYSNIHIDQYQEGTFIIDVIDMQSKELVWRGAYVERLGWHAPTDAEIRAIIIETLAQFPPAG
jgi:hypothetical protein